MSVAAITTVPGTACTLVGSRVDLAVGPFVGPNQAVLCPSPGGRWGSHHFVALRRRQPGHARLACSREKLGPRSPVANALLSSPRASRRWPRRSRRRAGTPRVSGFGVVNPHHGLWYYRRPRAVLRSGDDDAETRSPENGPAASSRAGHLSASAAQASLTDSTSPRASDKCWPPFAPTTSDTELERRGETLACRARDSPSPSCACSDRANADWPLGSRLVAQRETPSFAKGAVLAHRLAHPLVAESDHRSRRGPQLRNRGIANEHTCASRLPGAGPPPSRHGRCSVEALSGTGSTPRVIRDGGFVGRTQAGRPVCAMGFGARAFRSAAPATCLDCAASTYRSVSLSRWFSRSLSTASWGVRSGVARRWVGRAIALDVHRGVLRCCDLRGRPAVFRCSGAEHARGPGVAGAGAWL